MYLRDRLYELTTPEEVDTFLNSHSNCAFFKAGGCHKTMQGFGYVEQVMDARHALPIGFVKVIDNRLASNHIAGLTEIEHESPQFILIKEGKPVYHVDNWNIVPEALEAALLQYFGPVVDNNKKQRDKIDNIDSYRKLLEDYIDERLEEEAFAKLWVETFRMDSTLRSTEEFNLLNSLFGDVDAAFYSVQNGERALDGSLKTRARNLLQQISSC